jgi:hypothetical protein
MKAWSIKQIFLGSLALKIALVVFSTIAFILIPLPTQYQQEYGGNANLFAFYVYDGSNYLHICNNGYIDDNEPLPERIRYVSFLPGLPILNCAGRYVKSVINTRYYGPVIINLLFFLILCFSLKFYLDDEYKDDEGLKRYIALTYLFFPFAFFFHLNYTEVIFISLSFIAFNLARRHKLYSTGVAGFLMGFIRITSIPLGFFVWLKYVLDSQKNTITSDVATKNLSLFQKIRSSLIILPFGLGALFTFIFYQIRYQHFFYYFESQRDFYGRNSGSNWFTTLIDSLAGKPGFYDTPNVDAYEIVKGTFGWGSFISQTGFYFYDNAFRLGFLLWFPFAIAIIGSIFLIMKRRWFDLAFSWSMWIIPMLSANTASIDRYLLQSFPFIFVISEMAYRNKFTRYALIVIYCVLFALGYLLHSHGFWIG